jgi:hypothetical protein
MRADITSLDPSVTDFEADTVIFWYLANPQFFDTEKGKEMIAAIDQRNPSRFSMPEVEVDGIEQQGVAEPVVGRTDGRCEPIRVESGIDASYARYDPSVPTSVDASTNTVESWADAVSDAKYDAYENDPDDRDE